MWHRGMPVNPPTIPLNIPLLTLCEGYFTLTSVSSNHPPHPDSLVNGICPVLQREVKPVRKEVCMKELKDQNHTKQASDHYK